MSSEQQGTAGHTHRRLRIGKSVVLSACILTFAWPFIQEYRPGKFNREVWIKTTIDVDAQRVAMGKRLATSGSLIGLNRMQVSSMLGKPQSDVALTGNTRRWGYRLGTEGFLGLDVLHLFIEFDEVGVASKATVEQH